MAHEGCRANGKKKVKEFLNHLNTFVRCVGQGEAKRRKYKRLKLGGGQAYDRTAD
jgi:hypothetical protein